MIFSGIIIATIATQTEIGNAVAYGFIELILVLIFIKLKIIAVKLEGKKNG